LRPERRTFNCKNEALCSRVYYFLVKKVHPQWYDWKEAGVRGIPSPFINLDERGRDTPHTSLLPLILKRKDLLDEVLAPSKGSETYVPKPAISLEADSEDWLFSRPVQQGECG
jgi:hypothetical protein